MRKNIFMLLVSSIVFFYGCSAAQKAIKSGDDFFAMNNYYAAAQAYITALDLVPDNQKAKMKLCQVSSLAYKQKLSVAENFEKSSDFEPALSHYTELFDFLDSVTSYNCLSFPIINAKKKIVEMRSSASEEYYKEAERLFSRERYVEAIPKYKEALSHNNPYKDSTEKIAESYYRSALKAESQNSFRDAAEKYLNSNGTIEGYKDSKNRATYLYYSLGDYFFSNGLCRNAWDDFSEANKINLGFKNISAKINEAEACAISKIAFVKFDNPTRKNVAGMSIGDFIFDEIKSSLQKSASNFIRVLEREELDTILSEQNLGGLGITDEYNKFKQLKGVHYLISGKLTQVNVTRPNFKEKRMKATGRYSYSCIKTNRKGKQYEGTCWKDVPVYYTEYSDKISISLSGSIKVLDVSTGERVIFFNISSKKNDSVNYAGITSDISNVTIPSSLTTLANARKELKEVDALVKDVISEIVDGMVQEILVKIDSPKIVSDPINMKIYK